MAARKSTDQDPAATQAAVPADGTTREDGGAPPGADAGTRAAGPQNQTDAAPAEGPGPAGAPAGTGGATPTPVHLMPVAPAPPAPDPSLNETVPGGRYLLNDQLVNANGEPLEEDEDAEEEGSLGTESESGEAQADDERSASALQEASGETPSQAPQPTPQARPARGAGT